MNVKVKGIDKAIKFFDKALEKSERELTKTVNKAGDRIENIAKSGIPGEFSPIRSTVNKIKGDLPISVNIGSDADEAAYLNFGTGGFAVFKGKDGQLLEKPTKEWTDHAWEFFVNGLGRQYSVPFLTNAFEQERPKVVPEIEKGLKKALK